MVLGQLDKHIANICSRIRICCFGQEKNRKVKKRRPEKSESEIKSETGKMTCQTWEYRRRDKISLTRKQTNITATAG